MKAPRRTTVLELMERYEAFLLDGFGVLVDSRGALPGAPALLAALERQAKPWMVVTNDASRLPETWEARYRAFGLPIPSHRILTSGSLLPEYFAARGLHGALTLVLGPEDCARAVASAGGRVVALEGGEPVEALVVGDESGFPFLRGVDTALSRLFQAIDAGKEPALLLPNPDLVYPKGGGQWGIASGSVALILEAALRLRYGDRPGLRFVRLGKPEPALFDAALRRAGTRCAVMIGDQLETDIRGAAAAGIDSALLGAEADGRPTAASDGTVPTYLLPSLTTG